MHPAHYILVLGCIGQLCANTSMHSHLDEQGIDVCIYIFRESRDDHHSNANPECATIRNWASTDRMKIDEFVEYDRRSW